MTIALVFLLIALVFVLFVTEIVPSDLVALGVLVVVALAGWVTPQQALNSFANEAPITVAAMFILSAGLQRCGAIEDVGRLLRNFTKVTEVRLLVMLMVGVAACSAFINNTPVVVALLPLVLGVARHYDVAASKLLMPLSFAAILGGTCTLIGTSTNLVVSSLAHSRYGITFGLFDITGIGLIVAATGILYMVLIGRHLLPNRESLASLVNSAAARDFTAEMHIPSGSRLVGQRLIETEIHKISSIRVREVMREDGTLVTETLETIVLSAGDRLTLGGSREGMVEVETIPGLRPLHSDDQRPLLSHTVVVEAVVTNNSHFAGRTLAEARLREDYDAQVLAVHRHGENITRGLAGVRLRFGDTLLLRISDESVGRLRDHADLLVLSDTVVASVRREKKPIVLAVLAGVVVFASLGVYPISILALAGVVVMVATRCLRMSEVYDAIDWRIVSMIVGMIALGTAMENTGSADWLVGRALGLFEGAPPIVVLATVYFIATLLTEMISNNAVAILLTPIAVQTAQSLDLQPMPFLVAIMFAASASFATPIGYQTNTFVYGAGGYKFSDFLRVGVPLNLLLFVVSTLVIPLFFPLK